MKAAVVGLGLMGDLHARILVDMLGPESVVGVELDAERRSDVEDRLGIRTVAQLEDVLDEVDAVSVTLPDHIHVDTCVAALSAGKAVLVEKPLATTVSDCERIIAARRHPGQLTVGHVLRFDQRLRELKRRMDAGEFGRLRYVRIRRANSTAIATKVGDRVSVTAFLGVHDLDLLLWLTGQEIQSVSAFERTEISAKRDLSIAMLDLSDGTLAQVENHWWVHPDAARSCLAGVEVFGDQGMALLDLSTDELDVVTDSSRGSRRVDTRNWTHDAVVSGGSLRRELEAFVAMANGGPVPVTPEDATKAVHAVDLVERALGA